MPYEPEDEAGWSALPAAGSEDEQSAAPDSIGPLHIGQEPYCYRSKLFSEQQLTIVSQPAKVSRTVSSTPYFACVQHSPLIAGLEFPDLAVSIVVV